MTYTNRFLVGLLLLSTMAAMVTADEFIRIREFVRHGGTEKFNCAYKGKQASKPCVVIVREEVVKHPAFVTWRGRPAKISVIIIEWPDGDISKYTWSDSGEMISLTGKDPWGYELAGDEVTQDWSRGFVINQRDSEYIRIW
jgi:hypothetical protein